MSFSLTAWTTRNRNWRADQERNYDFYKCDLADLGHHEAYRRFDARWKLNDRVIHDGGDTIPDGMRIVVYQPEE